MSSTTFNWSSQFIRKLLLRHKVLSVLFLQNHATFPSTAIVKLTKPHLKARVGIHWLCFINWLLFCRIQCCIYASPHPIHSIGPITISMILSLTFAKGFISYSKGYQWVPIFRKMSSLWFCLTFDSGFRLRGLSAKPSPTWVSYGFSEKRLRAWALIFFLAIHTTPF